MKTTVLRDQDIVRKWLLVDAAGKPAGRLAVKLAALLRGRERRDFSPHVDMGNFVVVINAAKVTLSGKKEDQKLYKSYSGYPDGLKQIPAREIRRTHPDRIIRQAVRGMLPKNKLSRRLLIRLKVHAGAEHPHAAQQPQPVKF